MNERLPEYKRWLVKAEHDLRSAEILMRSDDPVNDTTVYHCQQVAEKSLKAMLAFWNEPSLRTHDITVLVEKCIKHDKSFEKWRDAAEELTPYATFFRYPGDIMEPDPEDCTTALEKAKELYGFVEHLLEYGPT